MHWIISYLPDESIIHIETEGEATVQDLDMMVKQAKKTCLEYNSFLFLVDHRKVVLNLNFLDIYNRPHALDTLEKKGVCS